MPFHWAIDPAFDIEDCEELAPGTGPMPAYHGTISPDLYEYLRPQTPLVEPIAALRSRPAIWCALDDDVAQWYAGIEYGAGVPGRSRIYEVLLHYRRGIRIERMWTPTGAEDEERLDRCLGMEPDALVMERYPDSRTMEIWVPQPAIVEIVRCSVWTDDGYFTVDVEQGDGSLRAESWRRQGMAARSRK